MHKRLLPHDYYDHIEEVINIVENNKVEKVIFANGEYKCLGNELIKVLEDKNIKQI